MKMIWWGLLFIVFDFNLGLGGGNLVIGLFPSFLGYVLFSLGVFRREDAAEEFASLKPFLVLLTIITSLQYFTNLLGFAKYLQSQPGIRILVNLVGIGAAIYFAYRTLTWMEKLEEECNADLYTGRCRAGWKFFAIMRAFAIMSELVPAWSMVVPLMSIIGAFIFLRDLKNTFDAYQVYLETRGQ